MALSPAHETNTGTGDMVVDEDGDVILEANMPKNDKRFRVSSKILSLASPVLRKMFHSGFKEAMELRDVPSQSVIDLPDDDADALLVICNALHHLIAAVPEMLPIETLVKMSMLSDKYDKGASLRGWSSTWVKKSMESTSDLTTLEELLYAAYSLDAAESFFEVSRKMICDQKGPFRTATRRADSSVKVQCPDIGRSSKSLRP